MVGTRPLGNDIDFSQREYIHLDHRIDQLDASVVSDVMALVCHLGVVVHSVVEVTKGCHHDYHHQVEDLYIHEYLRDKRDEPGSRLEETHPLEHFDPKEEAREATPDPQVLNADDDLVQEDGRVENYEEADTRNLRGQIDPVVVVIEILFRLLFELTELNFEEEPPKVQGHEGVD
jgi:hypothetical protein